MPSPPPRQVDLALLRLALDGVAVDPGAAQRRLAPPRRPAAPRVGASQAPREAAALAYLHRRDGRWALPLTVRRDDLPEHRGQVSLPGGRPQPGEDLGATARREAFEEIGLDPGLGEALGVLAPVYIPATHSNLHVHVVAGPDPGRWAPDPREVARLVIVHLDDLLDPDRRRVRPHVLHGVVTDVPYFDVEGLFLWGATAMALSELVERIRAAVCVVRGA